MKYVVACNRPWCKNLARILSAEREEEFYFIGEKSDLTMELLEKIDPQYIFFPHWSYVIPQEIYTRFECVIFHMTDVPYGRGGSPLQNLIARGIYETKITALRCVEELDAGPVYMKKPLSLYGTAEEIYLRASRVIEGMIIELLETQHESFPQEGIPTVFKRRKPEESDLSSAQSLEEVFDKIRMLDAEGYPHAFLNIGTLKIEFTRASMKTGNIISDARISFIEKVSEKDQ